MTIIILIAYLIYLPILPAGPPPEITPGFVPTFAACADVQAANAPGLDDAGELTICNFQPDVISPDDFTPASYIKSIALGKDGTITATIVTQRYVMSPDGLTTSADMHNAKICWFPQMGCTGSGWAVEDG